MFRFKQQSGFKSSKDALELMKENLEKDGYRVEIHEGRVYFWARDLFFSLTVRDGICEGTVRVGIHLYKGADGSEEMDPGSLCHLATRAMKETRPGMVVLWLGDTFYLGFCGDIRSIDDFVRVRAYAVDGIVDSLGFMHEWYPKYYEHFGKGDSQDQHRIGFVPSREGHQEQCLPAAEIDTGNQIQNLR